MDLFKIKKSIEAKDIPIYTVNEHDVLVDVLRKQKNDVSIQDICEKTKISKERFLEINNEISIHFRDYLAPNVLFKAMTVAKDDNSETFKMFFQRPDVDISCLFMSKIIDIKQGMKNLETPSYNFLIDNWKKYRGY
jgi:hypothetical protein